MSHPSKGHRLKLPAEISGKAAGLLKAYGMKTGAGEARGKPPLEKPATAKPGHCRMKPLAAQLPLAQPSFPPSPASFGCLRPKTTCTRRPKGPIQGAARLCAAPSRNGTASDLPFSWRKGMRQRPSSSGPTCRGAVRASWSDRQRNLQSQGANRMSVIKEGTSEHRGRTGSIVSVSEHEAHNLPRRVSGQDVKTLELWELYRLAREENMSVEEVVRMKDIFDSFDEDQGGTLDIGEFENVALRLLAAQLGNTNQAQERARQLCGNNFALMDSDGSGEVDFQEFLQWYSSRCFSESLLLSDAERDIRELAKANGLDVHTVDKVKEYFDAADTDGSGHIQFQEFSEVLPKMLKVPEGIELPESRIRFFWMEADTDGDNNIVFKEFLLWWLKHFTGKTDMQDFVRVQNPEIMLNFYRSMRRLDDMQFDPPPPLATPRPEAEIADHDNADVVHGTASVVLEAPA